MHDIYIYVSVYIRHHSDITITGQVYLQLYFTDAVVEFRYITCMRSRYGHPPYPPSRKSLFEDPAAVDFLLLDLRFSFRAPATLSPRPPSSFLSGEGQTPRFWMTHLTVDSERAPPNVPGGQNSFGLDPPGSCGHWSLLIL